ncbi:MAG: RluA family pseudouridine synthase [Saprospirales bacterium]|nr:MAG: RluA family pseudouridine synthase [Saprospirales bacterium]
MKHPVIEIIFEDNQLVVISKPSGLLSIPDRYRHKLPSAKSLLEAESSGVLTVHRLDRETSGIMVFAKNELAHKHLNNQFLERTVEKSYLLLVHGSCPGSGRIEVNIGIHPTQNKMVVVKKGGKASVTEFETVQNWGRYSLVRARLLTGRTHQLRVHFSHIGHEIVGDPLYSNKGFLFLSQFKKKYRPPADRPEKPLMERLALHADMISFNHPVTGDRLQFKAEMPKDFRASVRQLGLQLKASE